jgi:hypothetical protein
MEREWLTITGTVATLPALPEVTEGAPLPPANVPAPRARTGKTKAR